MGDDFKASVAVSREWDGKRVGQEIVDKIKEDNVDPDFILLFSTIQYEGEFEDFLEIINDEFSDAPLVGGTVAGFMCQEGCYTRGVSAMAVEYENMDVAVGVGHNTKRNPEDAAEECSKGIESGLKNSKFENKFIFEITSGPTTPQVPGIGSGLVLQGSIIDHLAPKAIEFSTKFLQRGMGREEEVLDEISKKENKSSIIGSSSSDDMRILKNYQFSGNEVYTNSCLALSFKTNKEINIKYSHGFKKVSDEKFEITDSSFDKKIIKEIDNEPALEKFMDTIGWPGDFLKENPHHKTFFFPLGFEYPDGTLAPAALGPILGKSFGFSYGSNSNDLFFLAATGESVINAMREPLDEEARILFGTSCCTNLVTLGDKIYSVQEEIAEKLEKFLIIFALGEGVYLPEDKTSKFFNETNIFLSIK